MNVMICHAMLCIFIVRCVLLSVLINEFCQVKSYSIIAAYIHKMTRYFHLIINARRERQEGNAFSFLQRVTAIPENVENPNLERQRYFRQNFRFICSFEKQSKYVQVDVFL